MKSKSVLTIEIIIVVIILLIVFIPTKLTIDKAEVSHRTLIVDNEKISEDTIDFVLSNEDVAAFEKVIKKSHMRFRSNVLKLAFDDYVNIQINDTTHLSIGIEITKYNLKSGHYVFLVQDGKYNKGTFINDSSYNQLVKILNKYDNTISKVEDLDSVENQFTLFAGGNSGEMPGGICPAINVNGKIYRYSSHSQKIITFKDGKISTVTGDTYLPDGYVKIGEIASITQDEPKENLQLQAGANATGSVYAKEDTPEVVYVLLETSWMVNKNCYCKFMSDDLYDSQCFYYDGNYYRITPGIYTDTEIVKELPAGSVVIGKLKYIGEDYVPTNDFETNCSHDCYGYSLDGRDVLFSTNDEGYLYVYMKSYWAEGSYDSWYRCNKYEWI